MDVFSDFNLQNTQYFGTYALSIVNDDNVNIRVMPSTTSEKIGKLNKGNVVKIKGFSDKREFIDDYNGYWLKISIDNKNTEYYVDNDGNFGWVFSKYINIDEKIDVSTLKIVHVNYPTERQGMSIDIEINRNGNSIVTKVYPDKLECQDFYTFVWSSDDPDFMFNDPVGVFKCFLKTNEIQHITYMGSICESAWCLITNDNKYMLQDYGTSPGIRGLGIYEISSNKEIFSGSYYRDLQYDGKSIVIVEKYDSWNIDKKRISNKSIEYAEKFEKEIKMSQEDYDWKDQGGTVSIMVQYRYYFDKNDVEYVGCKYIHEQ